MNVQGFLNKHVNKILETVQDQFVIQGTDKDICRLSISVDFTIFLIEVINELKITDSARAANVIDSLVKDLLEISHSRHGYKVHYVAASIEEETKLLSQFYIDGASEDVDELPNILFGARTMAQALYNYRAEKYFSEHHDTPFVCSALVPILLKNLRLENIGPGLIQKIDSNFVDAMTGVPVLFGAKDISSRNKSNFTRRDRNVATTAPDEGRKPKIKQKIKNPKGKSIFDSIMSFLWTLWLIFWGFIIIGFLLLGFFTNDP